jgi:hypothetical protein
VKTKTGITLELVDVEPGKLWRLDMFKSAVRFSAFALCAITIACGGRDNNNNSNLTNNNRNASATSTALECGVPAGKMVAKFQGNDVVHLTTADGGVIVLARAGEDGTGLYGSWDFEKIIAQKDGVKVELDPKEVTKKAGIDVQQMQIRFVEQGRMESHMIFQIQNQAKPCLAVAQATYKEIDGNTIEINSQGASTKL